VSKSEPVAATSVQARPGWSYLAAAGGPWGRLAHLLLPRFLAGLGEEAKAISRPQRHLVGLGHAYPHRYFEVFIAEQQLVAAATGLNVRSYTAFASTFAVFFTRAYDFIRMGAISGVDLRLVGSHAGVEIGAHGPSQMALEDLAMMRDMPGSGTSEELLA
jgi:Transketolase, pyrimidine binding domain